MTASKTSASLANVAYIVSSPFFLAYYIHQFLHVPETSRFLWPAYVHSLLAGCPVVSPPFLPCCSSLRSILSIPRILCTSTEVREVELAYSRGEERRVSACGTNISINISRYLYTNLYGTYIYIYMPTWEVNYYIGM